MAKANGLLPALEPGNIRQRFTGHNSQTNGYSPKSFTPSIKAYDIVRKLGGEPFLKEHIGVPSKRLTTIHKIAALNGIASNPELPYLDDTERQMRDLEEKLNLHDYVVKSNHIEVTYGAEINCYWHTVDEYHMDIAGTSEFDVIFYGYYLLLQMGFDTYLDQFCYALDGDMDEDEIKYNNHGYASEVIEERIEEIRDRQLMYDELKQRSDIIRAWINSASNRNPEYFYEEAEKNTPLGLFAAIINYLNSKNFQVLNYESIDPDGNNSWASLESQFIISWEVPDVVVEYLDASAQEGYDQISVVKKFYTDGRVEKTNIDDYRLLELLSYYSPEDQNFKFYGYSESTLQSYQSLIHLYLGRRTEFIHRNSAGQRWHIESGYTPKHVSSFGLIENAIDIDGFPSWRDPEGYDLLQRVSEEVTGMEVRASLPGIAVQ
jgi:hypothetical protein